MWYGLPRRSLAHPLAALEGIDLLQVCLLELVNDSVMFVCQVCHTCLLRLVHSLRLVEKSWVRVRNSDKRLLATKMQTRETNLDFLAFVSTSALNLRNSSSRSLIKLSSCLRSSFVSRTRAEISSFCSCSSSRSVFSCCATCSDKSALIFSSSARVRLELKFA